MLTVDELMGIEPDRLKIAFSRVRRELKFFPRPLEILDRLPAKTYGIFAEAENADKPSV